MKTLAIIPCRLAATRFPNKPLVKIAGIPMVAHILKRCLATKSFDQVFVATPDEEIFNYVQSIGGNAVMTLHSHERCTDRSAEALLKVESLQSTKFDIIAMVQGDEPLVTPEILDQAVQTLKKNASLPILNIIAHIESQEEFESPNSVKVVCDKEGHILYMSREAIPSKKKFNGQIPQYKQTGLIFFRRDFLIEYNQMPPTPLEAIESVDMLRVLENTKPIKSLLTSHPCFGVDVPSDVQRIEKHLEKDPFFKEYKNEFK